MKFIFLFILSFNLYAHEDLKGAPKSFKINSKNAVFVDFKEAVYKITYNFEAKKAEVVSTITFVQGEVGNPLFDVKSEPSKVMIDGQMSSSSLIQTPNSETQLRILGDQLIVGEHTLVVTTPLVELVAFDGTGVKSAFWTTDLNDRGYLERYMVSNYEFDRVDMTFEVNFTGATNKQKIYTNGALTEVSQNKFNVKFPDYFTSSSVFFHTVPVGSMKEINFTYRSLDGRDLPVTIYMSPSFMGDIAATLDKFKVQTVKVLSELESDYGPFLHPSVTIYNAGSGGMEYCGATMTEYRALAHELTHSYFARGIIPVNGNAGWIDEAIASWRDDGYPRITSMTGTSRMANRPYYTRFTDSDAYSYGAKFMSYLDGRMSEIGGLKKFLRQMVDEQAFTPYSTEDFVSFMDAFLPNRGVRDDFTRHVYGTRSAGGWNGKSIKPNPMHQQMSLKELENLL